MTRPTNRSCRPASTPAADLSVISERVPVSQNDLGKQFAALLFLCLALAGCRKEQTEETETKRGADPETQRLLRTCLYRVIDDLAQQKGAYPQLAALDPADLRHQVDRTDRIWPGFAYEQGVSPPSNGNKVGAYGRYGCTLVVDFGPEGARPQRVGTDFYRGMGLWGDLYLRGDVSDRLRTEIESILDTESAWLAREARR